MNDVQVLVPSGIGEKVDERLGVPDRWRQHRHDMPAGLLRVVPGPALIPKQVTRLRGHAPGSTHKDRRVGAKQQITACGDLREDHLEYVPIALIILDDQFCVTEQRPPDFKPEGSLTAKSSELPRQR